MPKEIVSRSDIQKDQCLALIKVYRLKNKRAGELKRAGQNVPYLEVCEHLAALAQQAEQEFGFSIWVNPTGRSGHTYPKDYRPSDDADNDYGTYLLFLNREDQDGYSASTQGFPHERSPGSDRMDD